MANACRFRRAKKRPEIPGIRQPVEYQDPFGNRSPRNSFEQVRKRQVAEGFDAGHDALVPLPANQPVKKLSVYVHQPHAEPRSFPSDIAQRGSVRVLRN
jgi:hypothetical protein